jgi:hypothetical protein
VISKILMVFGAIAGGIGTHSSCSAYEVATHAAMTFQAYARARVFQPNATYLQKLGLLELQKLRTSDMFGRVFFDFVPNEVFARRANSPGLPPPGYEQRKFNEIERDFSFLTIAGWMARGAIREDDIYWNPFSDNNNPQDDLCTNHTQPCVRVVNHFFDPYNNRQLSISVPFIGGVKLPVEKAPDWAIGTSDSFADQVSPRSTRSNHFSVFDAREAMFRALTLKTSTFEQGYIDIFPGNTGTDAERSVTQQGYWATTFRALGSVVHLVQDMAQPQHTRVDPHSGRDYDRGMVGHKSFYEWYMEARAKFRPFNPGAGRPVRPSQPLPWGAYPAPSFNSYTDYWSTARGEGIRPASLTGSGLADYSSRGFYTAGTNIGSPAGADFPQPAQSPQGAQYVTINDPLDMADTPLQGAIDFVVGDVTDTTFPGENGTSVLLSSYGIFDQFLRVSNKPAAYSLNVHNYDQMANLLIPRAVSYSAGLIDYFFRGELKLSLPLEQFYSAADFSTVFQPNAGFKKIKVRVRNVTPGISPPTDPNSSYPQLTDVNGKLVAVLRYRINRCLELPTLRNAPQRDILWNEDCRTPAIREGAGSQPVQVPPRILASIPVSAPATLDTEDVLIAFDFESALPFNATDIDLQVVYRGKLGTETDGIAVGFEYLSEPTFYNFDNFEDCFSSCTAGEGCNREFKLQLPFGQGIRVDASATVPAGRYARVAFLTYAGLRNEVAPNQFEYAANNQDYPYPVDVLDYGQNPPVVLETWNPGVKITGAMFESRSIGNTANKMLAWRSITGSGSTCKDASCFQSAANCPAITGDPASPEANAHPFPVNINF